MKCNTCNTTNIPTTCMTYQGKGVYFSSKLEDKTLEELIYKMSLEIKNVLDIINTSIDTKTIVNSNNAQILPEYIQLIFDVVARLQKTVDSITVTKMNNVVNISGTGLACSDNTISMEQAIVLLISEVSSLKAIINNSNSGVYIPNV